MLVLSRKKNEDIVITVPDGRTVTIKVVDIVGDKVRLGVTADPDVSVMRRELLTQPQKESHGLERPAT